MAYIDIGSKIINAYLAGTKIKQQNEQAQTRLKMEDEAHKARIEEGKAKLEEEKRQFDASHAIQKTLRDMQHQQALSGLQLNTAQTGLTPPDSTVTETAPPTEQNISQFTESLDLNNQPIEGAPAPVINKQVTLPNGLGSYSAPDPFSFARQQAGLKEIGQAPDIKKALAIAGGTEKIRQTGRMELFTEKAREDAKLKEQEFANKKSLQEAHDAATGTMWQQRNEATKEAARLRASAAFANKAANRAEKDSAISAIADDFKDGSSTFDQLPKGEDSLRLRGKLAAEGYRVISKKDQENLEGLSTVKQILNLYDSLNSAYKTHGAQSILSPEVRDLETRADALSGIMSRLYGGERGVLTEKDVERVKGARPSKLNTIFDSKRNDARMTDLKSFYNEKAKQFKGTMTPQQSQAVDKRFDLSLGGEASSDDAVDRLVKKHGAK